jgi:hypothetical protein
LFAPEKRIRKPRIVRATKAAQAVEITSASYLNPCQTGGPTDRLDYGPNLLQQRV